MVLPATSRFPGFYRLPMTERRALVAESVGLAPELVAAIDGSQGLPSTIADKMIENVVGTFSLPIGLGLNFQIDGRDYIVPMVVEEPSIVAAVSNVAQLVRQCGGFTCHADPPLMIGQVQLVEVPDPEAAKQRIEAAWPQLKARGDQYAADMVRYGGGMRDLEVRLLPDQGDGGGTMLVVHFIVDCRDAMGANTINSVAEGLAVDLAELTGGRAVLRILSNLADRRTARARCRVPVERLRRGSMSGEEVAQNILWAYRLAARDPYRAATHNKGIMNGIDAVAIATGNDWRQLEAGAHAYAARSGQYRSLTRYAVVDGHLECELEMPLAVGTVGGSTASHPSVRACREILGVKDASTLARVLVAVGLAQNLGALWALASEGIQRGHMELHAQQIALAAGAPSDEVESVARELVRRKEFRVDLAREIWEATRRIGQLGGARVEFAVK
ncbi:MAG: hydroxymethylglutaryl-CoA reductase, degradative [Deltaproteobacteria bacterium]|nr:hydroxymethylglutaryl-CoA reductase, degradative [Deltaproteobacteria bacterium]